jgi:hypothetical protein
VIHQGAALDVLYRLTALSSAVARAVVERGLVPVAADVGFWAYHTVIQQVMGSVCVVSSLHACSSFGT